MTPQRDAANRLLYKPIIFPNEFWHLRSQYVEINSTTPSVPLQIEFQPMSYWKFTIFAALTQSFAEAAQQQGATSGAELDEVKRMLVETNPYFLALTAFVSILHVVYVTPPEICSQAMNAHSAVISTDSNSSRSAPMYRTGGTSKNSLASLSGTHLTNNPPQYI